MGLLLKLHILQGVPENAGYFRPESQETVCAGRRRSIRRRTAKNELALAAEQGLILSDATLAVNRRV
jgi:hypothetical protein